MKKSVLAASAALAIAAGSMTIEASAADLEFLPPPEPFVPTWAGFYFGGHVGYGEASFHGDVRVRGNDPFRFRSDLDPGGLIGGVQGGYNWQLGRWVLGLEGDVSFADWSDSVVVFDAGGDRVGRLTADVDFLASIRGRAGFAFDNLLLYGTGGVAFSDGQFTARGDEGERFRKSFGDVGWVVGGGASWMVVPRTFSLGVEGLYYFFDEKNTVFRDDETRIKAEFDDAWVIRARGDFHF